MLSNVIVIQLTNQGQRIVLGTEVAFLINATSDLAHETFTLMKDTVQRFIEEHGDEQTKHQIIIHDKKSKKQYYDEKRSNLRSFDDPVSYPTDIRPRESKPNEVDAENVKDLENGKAKFPALHRDLDMADKYFFAETRESPVDKVRGRERNRTTHIECFVLISVLQGFAGSTKRCMCSKTKMK